MLVKPKNVKKISKSTESFYTKQVSTDQYCESIESSDAPPILLPYQVNFLQGVLANKHNVFIWEKSRRIGASWALASHAVLEASKRNGENYFYISVNKELAREFLDCCKFWAKAFQLTGVFTDEYLFDDEGKDLLAFRVNFISGKKIIALSSQPTSVRGLQGSIILDEFAHLENQKEFLKACFALTIWGAKIFIISTHHGVDNEFNLLCEETKGGKRDYFHQKTSYKDAISLGLYKRICLIRNWEYSKEAEKKYVEKIYKDAGEATSEEYDVIPKKDSNSSLFNAEDFNTIPVEDLPLTFDNIAYAWDFAATDKKKSCFTCGILLGKKDGNFYVLKWVYCKKNEIETQEFVLKECKKTKIEIPIYIEIEGGSQSKLWLENAFKPNLKDRRVLAINPTGSKSLRAIPSAEAVKQGKFYMPDCEWTDKFKEIISQFTGKSGVPLITDTGDALSLAFSQINKPIAQALNTGTVRKR